MLIVLFLLPLFDQQYGMIKAYLVLEISFNLVYARKITWLRVGVWGVVHA